MSAKTVVVDAQVALSALQQIMALLRASFPSVAAIGGPIGLGITAVVGIALPLIEALANGSVLSAEEQAKLRAEVDAITAGQMFSQPQWQPRPESSKS